MRGRRRTRTALSALLLTSGLASGAFLPDATFAQGTVPPAPAIVGPSASVGSVSLVEGRAWVAPAGTETWEPATPGRALRAAERIWVDAGSRAEFRVGPLILRMNEQSSVQVVQLADQTVHLQLVQGSMLVKARMLMPGTSLEIDTPNLGLSAQSAGEYRIDVDAPGDTTRVTVREGSVLLYGDDSTPYRMSEGQQTGFTGTALQQTENRYNAPEDTFEQWASQRDAQEQLAANAPVPVAPLPYEALDSYGQWREVSNVGTVWVPYAATTGWAPYRYGKWVWVAPWGWTWVDDAPWGALGVGIGRWAWLDGTWGWLPGRGVYNYPRPIARPIHRQPYYAGGGYGPSYGGVPGYVRPGRPGPIGPGDRWRFENHRPGWAQNGIAPGGPRIRPNPGPGPLPPRFEGRADGRGFDGRPGDRRFDGQPGDRRFDRQPGGPGFDPSPGLNGRSRGMIVPGVEPPRTNVPGVQPPRTNVPGIQPPGVPQRGGPPSMQPPRAQMPFAQPPMARPQMPQVQPAPPAQVFRPQAPAQMPSQGFRQGAAPPPSGGNPFRGGGPQASGGFRQGGAPSMSAPTAGRGGGGGHPGGGHGGGGRHGNR